MRRTRVYCPVHDRMEDKGTCKEKAELSPERGPEIVVFNPGSGPWVEHSLPLNWSVPDGKGGRVKLAPRTDSEGRAVFTSQREVREAVAKAKEYGEPAGYQRGMVRYG